MQFSGEQFIPGISKPRLEDEHRARYEYAINLAKGLDVLDIACGTGYGTYELSGKANSVKGVDISQESINYAKSHYQQPNLDFIQASACDPLFSAERFDLITSFETIEHLNQEQRQVYLTNLRTWLKPEGILLLSTPNKRVTSPYTDKPLNPFHIKEFTYQELKDELSSEFEVQQILGQRLVAKFLTINAVRKLLRLMEIIFKYKNTIYDLGNGPQIQRFNPSRQEPRIFFCVCRPK
ncbi:MAG: class I SAM-dependent methyltransferase [Patescibacteria group bacterium]|nr:class I SAM-dependent methyltransferase [Patescibacteria group bacterium]